MTAGWAHVDPDNFEARLGIDEPWLVPLLFLEGAAIGLITAWGIARRGKTGRDLSDTLKEDQRHPVLYLRAFEDDQRPFAWSERSSIWDWHVLLPVSIEDVRRPFSLEACLTEAIESSMGPLVALGSPDDFLSPGGAAREYAEDGDWRQEFLQLANYAQAIIVSPGSSDSLRWELACILRARLATKLFVVLGPHAFDPPTSGIRSAALHWAEKFSGFPEWRPVNWSEFRRNMTPLGYDLPIDRPDPSSIVTFDVHGRGSILRSRLQAPDDYVFAIKGADILPKLFDHLRRL